MSYNAELAERIEAVVKGKRGITSKKMFGGIAWMQGGNMAVGVLKDELMVRVGPERHDELLGEPGARPMDFTGRPMKGYLFVGGEGIRTESSLARWVRRGLEFAAGLPKKRSKR